MLDPTGIRRVKHAIRAWTARLSIGELIRTGPIEPVGEPIVIEPFEEIEVLRRTRVSGEIMALILWRDTPYLVRLDDLEQRTIRGFRLRRG